MDNIPGRSFQILFFVAITANLSSFYGDHLFADDKKKIEPNHTRLIMIDADGSNLRELFRSDKYTVFGSPAISPDGRKIAMDGKFNDRTIQSHILVINADGTGLENLGDGAMPTWSPDSKQLTFSGHWPRGVWIMNADGTNRELLDPDGRGSQWSPDGTMIIYAERTSAGANLKIYHTLEETFRYVFPFDKSPYSHYNYNFCWSPDSKSICFKGRTKQGNFEIVTAEINKDNQGLKVHYNDRQSQLSDDYAWHPDGKLITCTIQSAGFKTQRVFWFNPLNEEGLKPMPGHQYKNNAEDTCWSPDGKKLIFTVR